MRKLFVRLSLSTLLGGLISIAATAQNRTDIEFARPAGPDNPSGFSLTLDAYVPGGPGPFPAVIIVHGGGFINGDKQTYVKPLFEPLTQAGFAWFTINYRLFPKFRYPAPVEDVENAIRWVKAHAREYKVDPNRIVLMGESAGGYLVSYVGARPKPETRVAAVVSFYGVQDWGLRADQEKAGKIPASIWREMFTMPKEGDPGYEKSIDEVSPARNIKRGLPPFLLIHGTADKQVNYEQSVVMQQRMKKAGNVCDLITVEGAGHGMVVMTKFPETKDALLDWLSKTLKCC